MNSLRLLPFTILLLVAACSDPTAPDYYPRGAVPTHHFFNPYIYLNGQPQGHYDGVFESAHVSSLYSYTEDTVGRSIFCFSDGSLLNRLDDPILLAGAEILLNETLLRPGYPSITHYSYSGLSPLQWQLRGATSFPDFTYRIDALPNISIITPLPKPSLKLFASKGTTIFYDAGQLDSVNISCFFSARKGVRGDSTGGLETLSLDSTLPNQGTFYVQPLKFGTNHYWDFRLEVRISSAEWRVFTTDDHRYVFIIESQSSAAYDMQDE